MDIVSAAVWFDRTLHLAKRLAGAVALGVGSIFQPKPRPEDHWSSSPRVQVVSEAEADDSGDPPDGSTTPVGPP